MFSNFCASLSTKVQQVFPGSITKVLNLVISDCLTVCCTFLNLSFRRFRRTAAMVPEYDLTTNLAVCYEECRPLPGKNTHFSLFLS